MKSLARKLLEKFNKNYVGKSINEVMELVPDSNERFKYEYKNGYYWASDEYYDDDKIRTFQLYNSVGNIIAQIFMKRYYNNENVISSIDFGKNISHYTVTTPIHKCIEHGLKYVNDFLVNKRYPFKSIKLGSSLNKYGLTIQDNQLVKANG